MNSQIANYLDECRQLRATKTFRDYTARLRRFDTFIGSDPVWDRQTVVAYLLHLKSNEVGPASIALHESTVRSFYSWLFSNNVIAQNPVTGRAIMPYVSACRGDDFGLTMKEYCGLKKFCLKHGKTEWHGLLLVGWNTGLRLSDALRFGREHVETGALLMTPRKTKRFNKQIKQPINKELADWIGSFKALPERFFPCLLAQYEHCDASVSQQFARFCSAVGIQGKSFHSLRHQFVTRHLAAGVPIAIVSSLTGQSMKILQRYSHPTLEDQKKALEKMVA